MLLLLVIVSLLLSHGDARPLDELEQVHVRVPHNSPLFTNTPLLRPDISSSLSNASCTPENCKLPTCHCSSQAAPGGLTPEETPQFVLLTFDDAVNGANYPDYEKLQMGKNPNGCPLPFTFYVSHEYTDYSMVRSLYHQRHEIGVHSITHREPVQWWTHITPEEVDKEFGGMRTILELYAGVNASDLLGVRIPFLATGGNPEYMELKKLGFLYDSSMPSPAKLGFFPYTFDYASGQECEIEPCPTWSIPGFWEIPMTDLRDKQDNLYSMVDEYQPTSEDDAYNFLMDNFNRHYKSNRSPFPLYMHATWFARVPYTLKALQRFITDVSAKKDTWFVTQTQLLEWMRDPTPMSKINTFDPFQCSKPIPGPAPCDVAHPTICPYPNGTGTGETLWFHTCTKCPKHYPWYGNPEGN